MKRRAINHIIASILLIGLTVLAAAVVALIFLPMLNMEINPNRIVIARNTDPVYVTADNKTVITLLITNGNAGRIWIAKAQLTLVTNETVVVSTIPTDTLVEAGSGGSYTFKVTGNYENKIQNIVITFVDNSNREYSVTYTF